MKVLRPRIMSEDEQPSDNENEKKEQMDSLEGLHEQGTREL